MATTTTDSAGFLVSDFRAFNRRWTELLGLLDQGLLGTEHSLPEARVLFELNQRDSWERSELRERLGIDDSFLTRVLASLESRGLIVMAPSPVDGRRRQVQLSPTGHTAAATLSELSDAQITALIGDLTSVQQRALRDAMAAVVRLVDRGSGRTDPGATHVEIRGVQPGDLGWVVQRHGEVYWQEFGWNIDFEGLVAKIVADFHEHLVPGLETAWIAEVDGVRAGCVFCCRRDDTTAQLRILLVEPWARGLGLGARLVDECIAFARAAGYRSVMLWTNDVLVAARRIYEAAGFRLVDEDPHHSFGHDLVGQNWRLDLAGTDLTS